jgi:hypothetical protein
MKLAAKLGMNKLESAVRLMSQPEQRLDVDMKAVLSDPKFFEDGDVAIQLDGKEIIVHSPLMCQRCPFFSGLFKGRSAGKWLAGRRNGSSEPVKIDMKHIDPSTFEIVLQFLYADTGTEVRAWSYIRSLMRAINTQKQLYASVCSRDIDEFCDILMDVISVANEVFRFGLFRLLLLPHILVTLMTCS